MVVEPREVAAARRFTRFYTRHTQLLDEGFLQSRFSLTEGRILYELSVRGTCRAAALVQDLGLDAGYLSRILKRFEEAGLVLRMPDPHDGRQSLLSLGEAGREAFAPLDELSQRQWSGRLATLDAPQRARLIGAMATIEALLGSGGGSGEVALRDIRTGDLGWIAHRQGLLYASEYGWDETFEALVTEILVEFVRMRDPARERAWIAERGGDVLGSVFLVRQSDEIAKLRLLYVEPDARGLGLGARLVGECIAFARACRYRTLTLWTNDCLHAARHIYLKAGFRLVEEERHHSFGHDLVGQYWTLDL